MLVVIFDRATSIHSSPTVSRSSPGISSADDSMPVDDVCSVIAGIFRASALRLADCVQGEPALLGVLLETPVLHHFRGMGDRDHRTEAGRKQFLQRRTGRRHLDSRGGIRRVADVEKVRLKFPRFCSDHMAANSL